MSLGFISSIYELCDFEGVNYPHLFIFFGCKMDIKYTEGFPDDEIISTDTL